MDAIEIKNLNKSYKNGVKALDNFNLRVKKSESFSLLGENGAGKSTLIKILTGLIPKDSGQVKILGYDLDKELMDIRRNIASVSQDISIDSQLSLRDNMIFQARLYHLDRRETERRMFELIDAFSLNDYKDYPVSSYSGGVKRRLDIAMNMISNPKILFLDEPTVGMDLKSRKSMWRMIETIKEKYGTTIFLTTHYLEEADSLSDNILIMKDGRDIIADSPENLKSILASNIIEVVFRDDQEARRVLDILKDSFKEAYLQKNSILIDGDLYLVNKFLLENRIGFLEIKRKTPSIEEIFLFYTDEDRRAMDGHN